MPQARPSNMGPPIVNPYKRRSEQSCRDREIMGPQSQRRLSLDQKTYRLAGNNRRKRKAGAGDQSTLFGGVAFDSLKDCAVCKAKHFNVSVPHRAHHKLCTRNSKTKGITSATALNQKWIDQQLAQHFKQPLKASEKGSIKYTTKENFEIFFAPRVGTKTHEMNKSKKSMTTTAHPGEKLPANYFCSEVSATMSDPAFMEEHKLSRAPLPMIAFAGLVSRKILRQKHLMAEYFHGLSIEVPHCKEIYDNPQYHAIAGQKLLYVDWVTMFGLDIQCPCCSNAVLKNDRSNFSKNKILFPIFNMDAPPSWCIVMSMTCPGCKMRFNANDGAILAGLPMYAASAYPVATNYAFNDRNSHLSKSTTNTFDMLMLTYGNGELCSRLLYNALNRAYLDSASNYYSYNQQRGCSLTYPDKNGEYIRAFPPSGDAIRDMYDKACSSASHPWRISDKERHTREIQGVGSSVLFAEDHTHEVTKNYFRRRQIVGANAMWDVAVETGEIATAVLVPSTKTIHLSHAAIQLSKRSNFRPTAMYSDRWPVKSDYWENLFAGQELVGRLGLFHFQQRILRTLRKKHIDYFLAVNGLLDACYFYNQTDYNNLLRALKEGSLSGKYSDDDIASLKATKYFRQRYGKYLRKEIRPAHVMKQMLSDWFVRFKCSASTGERPALGRRDPTTQDTLFTTETKNVVENCKLKAEYLQDPLPLELMYHTIKPSPNSPHGLYEYLSRRGESNLESFHSMLAHFGNTGMRESLADNLNLAGTARYNLAIRHKLMLVTKDLSARATIPAGWETVLPYYNHSELQFVNALATNAGATVLPFPDAETLPKDNGERFFYDYLVWLQSTKPKCDQLDMCLCNVCAPTTKKQAPSPSPPPSIVAVQPPTPEKPATALFQHPQPPVIRNVAAATTVLPPPQLFPAYMPMSLAPPCWVPSFWCCNKYRDYCFRQDKRGRPPHDKVCRFKLIAT